MCCAGPLLYCVLCYACFKSVLVIYSQTCCSSSIISLYSIETSFFGGLWLAFQMRNRNVFDSHSIGTYKYTTHMKSIFICFSSFKKTVSNLNEKPILPYAFVLYYKMVWLSLCVYSKEKSDTNDEEIWMTMNDINITEWCLDKYLSLSTSYGNSLKFKALNLFFFFGLRSLLSLLVELSIHSTQFRIRNYRFLYECVCMPTFQYISFFIVVFCRCYE